MADVARKNSTPDPIVLDPAAGAPEALAGITYEERESQVPGFILSLEQGEVDQIDWDKVPGGFSIVSQEIRMVAGQAYVDVVIEVVPVGGAVEYEVRFSE